MTYVGAHLTYTYYSVPKKNDILAINPNMCVSRFIAKMSFFYGGSTSCTLSKQKSVNATLLYLENYNLIHNLYA